MAKASKKTPEEKLRVVLSVLRGELTAQEAARRAGVSEQSVHNWKRILLESGRDGLAQGQRRRSAREFELEAENEELKAALGEAHVALRAALMTVFGTSLGRSSPFRLARPDFSRRRWTGGTQNRHRMRRWAGWGRLCPRTSSREWPQGTTSRPCERRPAPTSTTCTPV